MPRNDGTGPMGGIGRRSELGFGAVNGCRRSIGYGLTKESIGLNDKEILEQEKVLLEKRLGLINEQLVDRV